MRMRIALAALLLAPALAAADGWEAAKKATKLPTLRDFLEKYVGSCRSQDPAEQRDCEANVGKERKRLEGKRYVVEVADAAPLVQFRGCGDDGCRFDVVPFVDGGGGFALSRGKPKGQDKKGNPILDLVVVKGAADPDDAERAARTGMLGLELVFEPAGTFQLPRPGGGKMEGVQAKWVALRVTNVRTGATLAERSL